MYLKEVVIVICLAKWNFSCVLKKGFMSSHHNMNEVNKMVNKNARISCKTLFYG